VTAPQRVEVVLSVEEARLVARFVKCHLWQWKNAPVVRRTLGNVLDQIKEQVS
jgi:hypothetical protein